MRHSVSWEIIPVPEESAPQESSVTEFLRRPSRPGHQSPDVFGRPPETRDPDVEIPEIAQ